MLTTGEFIISVPTRPMDEGSTVGKVGHQRIGGTRGERKRGGNQPVIVILGSDRVEETRNEPEKRPETSQSSHGAV